MQEGGEKTHAPFCFRFGSYVIPGEFHPRAKFGSHRFYGFGSSSDVKDLNTGLEGMTIGGVQSVAIEINQEFH